MHFHYIFLKLLSKINNNYRYYSNIDNNNKKNTRCQKIMKVIFMLGKMLMGGEERAKSNYIIIFFLNLIFSSRIYIFRL